MKYLKNYNQFLIKENTTQKNMNYNNLIVDFFVNQRGLDDLIESVYEGLYGGIHNYKIEPNEGSFNKDFLIKFILINQGDNDFDYNLGRIGYKFLTSDDGLKELSRIYLEELKLGVSDEDVYKNCIKSLLDIINS